MHFNRWTPKMENSGAILIKCTKTENRPTGKGQGESENQTSQKLSTRSILSAIGSKLFSGIQTESKKNEEKHEEKKVEEDEKTETVEKKTEKKEEKKLKVKRPNVDDSWKRCDRDFVKFKTRYNNSIGNIMRTWMSLIYCILILRLNLVKFVQENLAEIQDSDVHLQKQLREENLVIYKMIRKAQTYSQERCLFLWMHLEKLLHSRTLIKNALDVMRGRDANKDWKGAAVKLAQVEEELKNARKVHETLMANAFNEEISRLENISATKGKELEQIISQISTLKKREVQMRGRILLNMKNYKDLNNRRKYLLSLQKEMNEFKDNQSNITTEYNNKISQIQTQIEDSEKQIKVEKEEIKKLRANLEAVKDVSPNSATANDT